MNWFNYVKKTYVQVFNKQDVASHFVPQESFEESLTKARAVQAAARNNVHKKERVIKKKEKILEVKVRTFCISEDASLKIFTTETRSCTS